MLNMKINTTQNTKIKSDLTLRLSENIKFKGTHNMKVKIDLSFMIKFNDNHGSI